MNSPEDRSFIIMAICQAIGVLKALKHEEDQLDDVLRVLLKSLEILGRNKADLKVVDR